MREIERAVARNFCVQSEYFMGVKQGEVFESRDPSEVALYIVRGMKSTLGVKESET
ncbi:MAG: hypothetical protein V2A71_11245 [Candidatus Eisenbacteria bacterium]